MRQYCVRVLLKRGVITLSIVTPRLIRRDKHSCLTDDRVDVDSCVRRFHTYGLVDADDQLRHWAKPRKLRISHHHPEQFAGGRTAMHAIVRGAFPVEQRLVEVQQGAAEIGE